MENRIKNWLENLDIHAIKNPDEMKLQWHNFIQACQDDGMNITGFDTIDALKTYVAKKHVALQTKECKPKKFRSIYHAVKTCSSMDESRKVLFGFYIPEDRKTIVSTDGRRLLILPYSGSLPAGNWDLYTGKALKMLEKMTYDEYDAAMQDLAHPLHSCAIKDYGNLTYADGFWFQKLEGDYPDYMSVLPDECRLTDVCKPDASWYHGLQSALKMKKLLEFDSIEIGLDLQVLQSKLIEKDESGTKKYTSELELEDLHFCFNGKFFYDCFEILPQFCDFEKMKFRCCIDDATGKPIIISSEDRSAFYVLMPLIGNNNTSNGFTVNQMQKAPEKPAKKSAKSSAPEKPVIVEPVQEVQEVQEAQEVQEVQEVTESQEIPVLDVLPESEPITPVNQQSPVFKRENIRTSGLSPRAIKNLSYIQVINGDQMSRFEFIRGMSEAGILKTAIWEDSKGKLHYLVNGQFLGQVAYNYANSIIAGNIKIATA
jgi:DNA polymerase III sliding clamp (beta) subunit (PCNA family)